MWARLKASKTAWVAVGGILVALGSALAGQLTPEEAIRAVFEGLVILFLRDAVGKTAGG